MWGGWCQSDINWRLTIILPPPCPPFPPPPYPPAPLFLHFFCIHLLSSCSFLCFLPSLAECLHTRTTAGSAISRFNCFSLSLSVSSLFVSLYLSPSSLSLSFFLLLWFCDSDLWFFFLLICLVAASSTWSPIVSLKSSQCEWATLLFVYQPYFLIHYITRLLQVQRDESCRIMLHNHSPHLNAIRCIFSSFWSFFWQGSSRNTCFKATSINPCLFVCLFLMK